MIQVHGYVYEGGSSRRHDGTLQLYDDGTVRIAAADDDRLVPLDELSISSRLGSTPRQIRFADGTLFETDDNDSVDQWLKLARPGSTVSLAHRFESRLRLIIPVLLLAVAGAWLMLAFGLPVVAKSVAFTLPPHILDTASEETLAFLDKHAIADSELPETRRSELNRQFDALIEGLDGHEFNIEYRKGGDYIGANAFALPSGTIIVTDELVALAEWDEEIVGVMAHEIGHVVHRHSLRQVLQGSVITLGMLLITGEPDSLLATVPAVLVTLGYSRDFEHEGDRYAQERLAALGLDPGYLDSMLLRLEQEHAGRSDGRAEESSLLDYLSTHPPTRERVSN